jgi:ribosome-binding protein aMBF1 (putative translation factor)
MPKADDSKRRDPAVRRERAWIHESVVSVARGARQDRDVSQQALAATLGWSKSVIVNFENLRRDLGVADLIMMAEKLDMDPQDLFASVMFHLRQRRKGRKPGAK